MQAASMAAFLEKHLDRLAEVGSPEWRGLSSVITLLQTQGAVDIELLQIAAKKVQSTKAKSADPKAPKAAKSSTPSEPKQITVDYAAALRASRGDVARGRAILEEVEANLGAADVKELAALLHMSGKASKAKAMVSLHAWVTTEAQLKAMRSQEFMAE
jgi:hypothetical protein